MPDCCVIQCMDEEATHTSCLLCALAVAVAVRGGGGGVGGEGGGGRDGTGFTLYKWQ